MSDSELEGKRARFAIDITPLKKYPDFRNLWASGLITYLGSMITYVAVPFQINAGLVYTGPIPGRDEDVLMAGLASGQIGDVDTGGPTGNGWEVVLEVGYRIQLPGTAFFQPNLQWILQPGGGGGIPNALVLGAQMGVSF